MECAALTIVLTDKFHNKHERTVTQVEYETDEAFLERARRMLEQLRCELP